MVKQSRLVTGSSRALQAKALGEMKLSGSRLKGLGRATGLVAVGLVAAIAAPRVARANVLFEEKTAYTLGATQPCTDTLDPGCFTNWLQFVDIDNDGDFDILSANGGGIFTTGNSEQAVVYRNDGKGSFYNINTTDALTTVFANTHMQSRQFAVGDIDGDGDVDIYMPGGYGVDLDKLFVQTSVGVYADKAATLLPADLKSSAGAAHLGDLDGDGDLDLVVADWGTAGVDATSRLLLYTNDGKGVFTLKETQHDPAGVTAADLFPPTIPATMTAPYFGARPTDLDFADVDGDFDLDILINHREGYSRIFLNDGQAKFSDGTGFLLENAVVTAKYAPKQGPFATTQELCDLDEDGDLDLILDNSGKTPATAPAGGGNNVTQVLINDGKGVFVDQTATRIVGEPASTDGALKCVDVDSDGHYDLVIASRTHTNEKVLLNGGTGVFTYVGDVLPKATDLTVGLDVGDLNGDGRMDVMTGQSEGLPAARLDRVYTGLVTAAADTTPPAFRAIQKPVVVAGQATTFLIAVRDGATNDAGQMVGSVSVTYTGDLLGSTAQQGVVTRSVKAKFIGGDLFRVTVPAMDNNSVLTLTPTAVDRSKLTKTATPIVFTLGTPIVPSEGGAGGETSVPSAGAGGDVEAGAGAGGEVATGGTGGTPAGGSAGKGATGGTVAEGGSQDGEAGEAGTAGSTSKPGDDGGCGCSTAPSNNNRTAAMFGLGLGLFGLVRRRRNK